MDREKNFVPIYESLAQEFPKLKIIMEHITTKESAELVLKYDNLFATITLQHLYITLDDVAG
jgi:dihydroorotase